MRWIKLVKWGVAGGALTVALSLNPGDSLGQGRGMPTADDSFNQLLQSYGGTGDSIEWSKIPPDRRERSDRFAQFTGGQPLPTSGFGTRAEYKQVFDQRMQAVQAKMAAGGGGMGGGRGGPGGGMGGPGGGATMTMTVPPGGDPAQQGMGGGRGGRGGPGGGMGGDPTQQGGGRGGRGQGGPGGDPTQQPNPQFGGGTSPQQQQWGGNQQQQWGGNGGGWDPSQQGQGRDKEQKLNTEPDRPTVFRYGKMPKDIPAWFTDLDDDKDGQIAMYEWRRGGKEMDRFLAMDLNADGLLTADEYLRYRKIQDPPQAAEGGSTASTGGGRGGSSASTGGDTAAAGGGNRWNGGSNASGPPTRGGPGGKQGKDSGKDSSGGKDNSGNNGGGGKKRNPFNPGG